MNPSKSSGHDPNEPYRRAIQALADGYAYVPYPENANTAESSEPGSSQNPHWHGLASASALHFIEPERGQNPLLEEIRSLLKAYGIDYARVKMSETVINARVMQSGFSYENIRETIRIIISPQHPLMTQLQPRAQDIQLLLLEVAGFLRHQGWRPTTLAIFRNAQNQPYQLINALFNDLYTSLDRRK